MSYLDMDSGQIVAKATENERSKFIRKTYLHLAAAIAVFAVIEFFLFQTGLPVAFMKLLAGSQWLWLGIMVLYMGVSYIADRWAHSGASRELQYAGLGLYIVALALIMMPLLLRAMMVSSDILPNAALVTGALVAGITFTAFTSKVNFSFLGKFLMIGGFIAMGMIVAAILFGFSLGVWFAGAMVVFAAVSVLYSTSNIIHEYHTEQYVAASLSLFSSIGLLFWYIVQLFTGLGGDD